MQKSISIFLSILMLAPLGWQNAYGKSSKKKKDLVEELKLRPGDEAGNDIRALKAELLINQNEKKAARQLRKLLRRYKGTAMEASLRFRLAELYMRRSKTSTFFEVNKDNKNVVSFSPSATRNTSSRGWIRKAVKTYDRIERRFTHYRDMDLVLFNNAFARQLLGQKKQPIKKYRRVITQFPGSPLVPDSHLAIGESLFDSKKFSGAFAEFQAIRKFPDSKVYPYGLYKGSWSLYNMRRTSDALGQMEEVVAYSKKEGIRNSRLDLTNEALDDMVIFYEDVRKPSNAVDYFREQGGDKAAGRLVYRLGQLYKRHSRFKSLEIVYGDLISHLPLAKERIQVHRSLLDGFDTSNRKEKAVKQLEVISSLCVEESDWAKAQDISGRNMCWNQLEAAGKKYASRWHRQYKKRPSEKLASVTEGAYRALLKFERKFAGEDKLRFNYAELLFQGKKYREASRQYFLVSKRTKSRKFRHDGAHGAIVSLEKAVKDKWSDSDEREFAKLAGNYIKLNPKGKFVTDIRFKKAFIAYEKGRYAESAPQLKKLALQFKKSPRGKKAASLYLDILNIQKDFTQLRSESRKMSKVFAFDPKLKRAFEKIHQEASFTVVQKLEEDGKYQEAIKGYLTFVKQNPRSTFADKALYNAIRGANIDGNLVQASGLIERLLAEYPSTKYRNELRRNLVSIYEAQAQLGKAAEAYLDIISLEPKKRWSYTMRAADYRALDGNWSGARLLYLGVIDRAQGTPHWMVAKERLLKMAENSGKKSRYKKILRQIAASGIQPQASLATLQLARKAFEERDDAKTFSITKRIISMRKQSGVAKAAVAEARYLQGRVLEKEFARQSVKSRPERLGLVLAIKTEKLEKTQKAYQAAIGYGDPQVAVKALVRLAGCYDKFALSLRTIKAPKNAPPADQKKFLAEIENMAFPIEEKNADTLALALKEAKKLKMYDGTVAEIQMRLNTLARRAPASESAFKLATPDYVLPVVR